MTQLTAAFKGGPRFPALSGCLIHWSSGPEAQSTALGRVLTSARLRLGQHQPLATAPTGRQERPFCSGCGRSTVNAKFTVSAPMQSLSHTLTLSCVEDDASGSKAAIAGCRQQSVFDSQLATGRFAIGSGMSCRVIPTEHDRPSPRSDCGSPRCAKRMGKGLACWPAHSSANAGCGRPAAIESPSHRSRTGI